MRKLPAALLATTVLLPARLLAAETGTGALAGLKDKPALAHQQVGMGDYFQVFLGLVAVLAMIGVMAWLARRVGHLPGGVSGSLRILGGLSMGQRERIVLVQVGDKQLLLGVAPGRVQTLHVLDEPLALAGAGEGALHGSFAERLSAALKARVKP